MTELTGKSTLSLRKKDIIDSSRDAFNVGRRKIRFAHQASNTGGDTYIPLDNLNFPSFLVDTLYENPDAKTLTQANLRYYYPNMQLMSTSKGILIPDISFTATNTKINFEGFTADPDEIFYGIIDYSARPNTLFVDAVPVNVSRTLPGGQTTFNVGEAFRVNEFINESSGAVKVYVDGNLVYRNSGNSSVNQDKDYYEVPSSNGLGTAIEFNSSSVNSREVTVVSNYAYVDRPEMHFLQRFDILAAQLEEIAQQGGYSLDLSAFPNRLDLKQFGDRLIAAEQAATDDGKVGDVVESLLDEVQFQNERNSTWVLADGRNVAGSKFENITNMSNVPDARGMFLRGKNNGRNDGLEDPAGERNLGDFQNDEFKSHTHSLPNLTSDSGSSTDGPNTPNDGTVENSTGATGGDETRPKNIAVNYFIKIND